MGDTVVAANPLDTMRARADALCRTAAECGRLHERGSRLAALPGLDVEQRAARDACALYDKTLETLVAAYEKCAARQHPDGDDEAWWHKANALWMASREYLRRHSLCDQVSRQLDEHSAGKFGELQLDYELEASALLALQQATDAYCKVRPEVR